jgi:hypothetical protein
MAAQGEAVANKAMSVVGQLGRGGLCKGGLAPAVGLDYAEHKFLSAVSYGVLVWGYVGLLRNGIGKVWAEQVERQQVALAKAILSAPDRVPNVVVLAEVGWTSVGLRWTEKVLQEWGRIKALPTTSTERVIIEAEVRLAIEAWEKHKPALPPPAKDEEGGTAVSQVGHRIVAAAKRLFGFGGWRQLQGWRSTRSWKRKVKEAFGRAAQREYTTELSKSETGRELLLIKPLFGRAQWIDDARDSVRWGKQVGLYLLHRLRGAGHDLRTVTCRYWWTTHDGMCRCNREDVVAQTPEHWLFECELTRGLRLQYFTEVEEICGRHYRRSFEGMDRHSRWLEAMAWLDGRRGREATRGDMLMALLNFVCKVTKIKP